MGLVGVQKEVALNCFRIIFDIPFEKMSDLCWTIFLFVCLKYTVGHEEFKSEVRLGSAFVNLAEV